MNITLPAHRTYAKAPFLLALLGTLAIAAVVARDGVGSKDGSSTVSPVTNVGSQGNELSASLTFILVSSAEEADYLRSLQAETESLLDARASKHDDVILTAGTPEQEARAMDTINAASDAWMSEGLIPVHVVNARDDGILPR